MASTLSKVIFTSDQSRKKEKGISITQIGRWTAKKRPHTILTFFLTGWYMLCIDTRYVKTRCRTMMASMRTKGYDGINWNRLCFECAALRLILILPKPKPSFVLKMHFFSSIEFHFRMSDKYRLVELKNAPNYVLSVKNKDAFF